MPRPKGSENKKKTNKSKKENDGPKKGKSSFFFYLDAKKEEAKKKNPSLQHKELISELSQEWKNISKEEKLPYIILANKDRERFQKEKEACKAKQISKDEQDKVVMLTSKRKHEILSIGESQLIKKTRIVK